MCLHRDQIPYYPLEKWFSVLEKAHFFEVPDTLYRRAQHLDAVPLTLWTGLISTEEYGSGPTDLKSKILMWYEEILTVKPCISFWEGSTFYSPFRQKTAQLLINKLSSFPDAP